MRRGRQAGSHLGFGFECRALLAMPQLPKYAAADLESAMPALECRLGSPCSLLPAGGCRGLFSASAFANAASLDTPSAQALVLKSPEPSLATCLERHYANLPGAASPGAAQHRSTAHCQASLPPRDRQQRRPAARAGGPRRRRRQRLAASLLESQPARCPGRGGGWHCGCQCSTGRAGRSDRECSARGRGAGLGVRAAGSECAVADVQADPCLPLQHLFPYPITHLARTPHAVPAH